MDEERWHRFDARGTTGIAVWLPRELHDADNVRVAMQRGYRLSEVVSNAVRNWLMGVSIPKQDKLMVLAQWLQVTPEALLFGAQPPCPVDEQFSGKSVNLVDKQLIAQYFKLAPQHRVAVRLMVDALLALGAQQGINSTTA